MLEADGGRFLAVRLGMRMVKGLSNAHAAEITAARGDSPYSSVEGLRRCTRVPMAALQRLAEADAFLGLGLDRREALWAIRGLRDDVLPLFAAAEAGHIPQPELMEPAVTIVPMIDGREVVEDYAHVGLTLRQHPVTFLRDELRQHGVMPCADLLAKQDGRRVTVAGLVLVRQRPGTATGVIFITLEDETGIANLVIWSSLFERQRGVVLSANMLECRGRVQREGDVIHVVAEELSDLTPYSVPWAIEAGRGPTIKGSKLLSGRASPRTLSKWRTHLAAVCLRRHRRRTRLQSKCPPEAFIERPQRVRELQTSYGRPELLFPPFLAIRSFRPSLSHHGNLWKRPGMTEQTSTGARVRRPRGGGEEDRHRPEGPKGWLSLIVILAMAMGFHVRANAQQPFAGCLDQFWDSEPPALVMTGPEDALCATHFATLYSEQTETPRYSAEHLTPAEIEAAIHDDRLPEAVGSTLDDYRHSGCDRGHMAPSGDEPDEASQFQSFALSNIVPQNANDNRYLWADIEFSVRELVLAGGDDVYVVTGPIFGRDDPPALNGHVQVPALLFKAVYDPAGAIAGVYVARNASGHQYWSLSLARFAALYGIRPFPGLTGSLTTMSGALPTRPVALNRQRAASRLARGGPKRFEFDPANTWRRRRSEETRIEASGGRLSDELFVSARRMMGTGLRRSAKSLGLLVERGLLVVSNEDDKLRCFITREECELIRRWLGAKPQIFSSDFHGSIESWGFQQLEAVDTAIFSNSERRENDTLPGRNRWRPPRPPTEVSPSKNGLSRDFESPSSGRRKPGQFLSHKRAVAIRTVAYHAILCGRLSPQTLTLGDGMKPPGQEEASLWRKVP
ncbi:hypothetical protein Dimus_029197 [Dionaea muscipula]